jgi:hypothetical protein
MYDPTVGQFISEDPIGFNDGGTNTYEYCDNSPTNATDPTGEVTYPSYEEMYNQALSSRPPKQGGQAADRQLIDAYESYYGKSVNRRRFELNEELKSMNSPANCERDGQLGNNGNNRLNALEQIRKEINECNRYCIADAGVGTLSSSGGGTPVRGDFGKNSKQLLPYFVTQFATPRDDRRKPIPRVTATPPAIPPSGPQQGNYEVKAFPNSITGPVGGGGALTCILLVVKDPGGQFVAVFHFEDGDSPSCTLNQFSWPAGCEAVIGGGITSGSQVGLSNCLADDVIAAANAAGLNIVGVSGNSCCGVDENGNWYQTGN